MPRVEQEIVIGKIVAPFGTGGEVKVLVLTDFPERFGLGEEIRIRTAKGARLMARIERSREHKAGFLLKLGGIDSRDDAEALRDAEIVIDREKLAGLGKDRYYVFDIIGLRVTSEDGRDCGEVTDVLQAGANDVYLTSTGLCIPALKDVVAKVDLERGEMIIRPVPGLLPDTEG